MKALIVLNVLLVLYGCNYKPASATTGNLKIKTTNNSSSKKILYQLNKYYAVIDTGEYDTGILQGDYAIISKDNIIDTINRYFGVKVIGDKYLYLKITRNADLDKLLSPMPGNKKTLGASEQGYLLIDHGKKQNMINIALGFDSYFSSPSVINDKIYYWQLIRGHAAKAYKVSAAEYNPLTKALKSYYIEDNPIDTDDNGYFRSPYLKNDTIYFEGGYGKVKKFATDFKPYN